MLVSLRRLPTKSTLQLAKRLLSTSLSRTELVEVGRFTDQLSTRYKPGQLFLHRVFAYRGIIVCAFECKEFGGKNQSANQFDVVPYYQVLVHRGDWKEMRFAHDQTAYLSETPNQDGKTLSTVFGMDSVPHADILPMSISPSDAPADSFKDPIEHDLFKRLFQLADAKKPEAGYNVAHDLSHHRLWLAPQATHVEVNENVRVAVTIYYLGQNTTHNQNKHCWRYQIRLENLDERDVLLRERHIKVFSLNNLMMTSGGGSVGEMPRLTRESPAYQFSSTVDLAMKRGGHLWGKLKLERDDGTCFEVNIPTCVLECSPDINMSHTSAHSSRCRSINRVRDAILVARHILFNV